MKQKFYYLSIPESQEQIYFAIGGFMLQLIFKDQKLTISNSVDRFPDPGTYLYAELEECSEECFNYYWQGALVCLNQLNGSPRKMQKS